MHVLRECQNSEHPSQMKPLPFLILGLSLSLILKSAAADFEKRPVTIFSDGVRMAGDLYTPKGTKADEKLPCLVLCCGTGGTKARTGNQTAPHFAQNGYMVLAFDYRGWGQSDSKLITVDPQSRPDAKGEVQVKARAVRWQMDYTDQLGDIRAAISFIGGEPNADCERIGLWGTSYGGGLVTWIAGNDPRVRAVVAQVPGMGAGRSGAKAQKTAYDLLTKQARGETEAVPFETGQLGGKLSAYAQMRSNPAKGLGFYPLEAAAKIKIPAFILDASDDELMNIKDNGGKAAEIIKANGVEVEYHVIPGITHYGVYKEKFQEVTALEIAWLDQHLKKAPAAK